MSREEDRAKKPYRLIKIKRLGLRPIIFPTDLYVLPGKKKYSDVLKCAKHYDTKKLKCNSKERYARLLFYKIIKVYLELLIHDLIYSMKTVEMPFQKTKFFIKLSIKKRSSYKFLFDRDCFNEHVAIRIFWYNIKTGKRHVANGIPSNKFKGMLKVAYDEGVRYNNKKAEYYG